MRNICSNVNIDILGGDLNWGKYSDMLNFDTRAIYYLFVGIVELIF
jgi:hypothetical protein